GDLPGVPDALPPDHDDHDGGADGEPADRTRSRRWRGNPAASGSRGSRRPGRIAGVDSVHHAGYLSVLRAAATAPGSTASGSACIGAGRGRLTTRRIPRANAKGQSRLSLVVIYCWTGKPASPADENRLDPTMKIGMITDSL